MTYLTQSRIADNPAMYNRVAQCAASEDIPDPDFWTSTNRRGWSAAPGWAAAWEYALLTHPDEPDYDPGQDETVVTDEQILAQVQTMRTAETPTG